MAARALAIHMGREAAQAIERDGWTPALFSLLLGASGGPKCFILAGLDRYLFNDFLQRSDAPLSTLGSSIGSWRHACLAQDDPAAAVDRMIHHYMHQSYSSARPGPEEISAGSLQILDAILGERGAQTIANHPRIRSHIVTARGRGAAGSRSSALLATGMGAAALGNTVSRKWLRHSFQRVVFHNSETPETGLSFPDFDTAYTRLQADNVAPALHASGSIPFVLTGERDIPGAPQGQYWDGGIIDYHFDLEQYHGDGLILYPHFSANIVPGWFDKFLPWRKAPIDDARRLVLLCPDERFVAGLPEGKIPDRSDFTRMSEEARISYWQACVEAAGAMAEEFASLVEGSDPLAGVKVYT
ncbi:patatin-like phospholipase family protein [Halioglobus maricola]|uniref:Patatin-like phospholipase family protein n=1 Tax=Halioglobus maricola TaxID=2601894 RepID=A0A5P9NQ36_9GAMM|nr:patatin-like phospholipase family protein [Halioglobus maricola]QFU76958.1 patatin-like phospholipase family protein [Halioglobus maricola]